MVIELAVALIVTFGGVVVAIINNWDKVKSWFPAKWVGQDLAEALVKKEIIEEALLGLHNFEEVEKAVLIRVDDSGKIISPTSKVYGSIVSPVSKVHTFDRQLLDQEYLKLIRDVYKKEILFLKKEAIHPESMLYHIFSTQGIKATYCVSVADIRVGDPHYLFLSVDLKGDEPPSEEVKDAVRRVANLIRNKL